MSHLKLLYSKTVYATLTQFDADLAAEVHARGCPCGGRLHRADYPRKPRGGPADLSPCQRPPMESHSGSPHGEPVKDVAGSLASGLSGPLRCPSLLLR